MPGTKRTFENDDDLFHRKPYAEFLKNLILNCDNYHRDDDVKAYTIAMDSSWGTGKSVFLEKFESMLEQRCSDTICVVHYNAWKSDFWSNAFEPFAEALFSSECFAKLLIDQSEGKSTKKFISACKDFGIAFLKGQLEKQVDIDRLEKSIQGFKSACTAAIDQKPDAITDNYRTYTKQLKELQNAMEDFLDEALPNGKLLIVIDELDRCKPTFAIETLEIVKHIMDVPNVVYLFALDIHQLGAAVKQVYGAETDSVGYLMRFFSYYARMPEAKKQYIVETIANTLNLQIHDDYTDSCQLLYDESDEVYYTDSIQKLKFEMVKVSNALGLSVRDLETVGKVFELMHSIFLKRYQNRCAYLLYWLLLCSKYKQPLLFDEWMNSKNSEIDYPVPSEQAHALPSELLRQLEMLSNQDPMSLIYFSIRESPYAAYEPGDRIVVSDTDTNDTEVAVDYEEAYAYAEVFTKTIDKQGDISGVLFLPDLLNWEKIGNLTLKQYYSQQLEMYTFLPTI